MRDRVTLDYINRRQANPDEFWAGGLGPEKNLYISIENKSYLPILLVWCGFCFLCGMQGLFGIAVGVFVYSYSCEKNNEALDKNPHIRKLREQKIEYRIRHGIF